MNTTNQTPEQEHNKVNQIIAVEYEIPLKNGHFITMADSYRNKLGLIHRHFSKEQNKFIYTAFDHTGKQLAQGEKLWEVKKVFYDNKEKMLEDAHQRRIAAKQKKETENQTQEKTNEVQQPAPNEQNAGRAEETKQIRQRKTQKKEQGISR